MGQPIRVNARAGHYAPRSGRDIGAPINLGLEMRMTNTTNRSPPAHPVDLTWRRLPMYLDCWTLQNVCCHPELRQTPHITPKTYEDIQKNSNPSREIFWWSNVKQLKVTHEIMWFIVHTSTTLQTFANFLVIPRVSTNTSHQASKQCLVKCLTRNLGNTKHRLHIFDHSFRS
jgi:hypothetical protein